MTKTYPYSSYKGVSPPGFVNSKTNFRFKWLHFYCIKIMKVMQHFNSESLPWNWQWNLYISTIYFKFTRLSWTSGTLLTHNSCYETGHNSGALILYQWKVNFLWFLGQVITLLCPFVRCPQSEHFGGALFFLAAAVLLGACSWTWSTKK